MSLALFDFDGTVTTIDTTLPLGAFVIGEHSARHRLLLLVSALGLAKVRLLSNTGLKRALARLLLRGQTLDHVRDLALQFHDAHLSDLVDDRVLNALQAHVDSGDCVYLVSANFDCLLEPLVNRWSLAGVIATRAEHRAGIYTGGVVGTACHGHEKLQRAVARFGATAVRKAIAYGNQDDSPLLHAVRTSYVVRRAKASLPLGRLRQCSRVLSGQLNRDDLTAASTIEPFPTSQSPGASTPS